MISRIYFVFQQEIWIYISIYIFSLNFIIYAARMQEQPFQSYTKDERPIAPVSGRQPASQRVNRTFNAEVQPSSQIPSSYVDPNHASHHLPYNEIPQPQQPYVVKQSENQQYFQPAPQQHHQLPQQQHPTYQVQHQTPSTYNQQLPFISGPFANQQTFLDEVPGLKDNHMAKIGLQYGTQALQNFGSQYVNSGFKRYFDYLSLKYYFSVSNRYVVNKLCLLFFPFRHKSWARIRVGLSVQETNMTPTPMASPTQIQFAEPRDDVNAPDLYIPVMSFVSYVLLMGFAMGRKGLFKPEMLGVTSSTAFLLTLLQVIIIKLGSYFLGITSELMFVDAIAYISYQYVGTIACIASGSTFGGWGYYIMFLYTSICIFYFLLNILKRHVLPDQTQSPITVLSAQRKRRNYFLLTIAFVNIGVSYVLSRKY